jgi:uncharacterized membrane protein
MMPLDDARVERLTANLLRGGVIAAAIVTIVGAVALLAQQGASPVDYHAFAAGPLEFRSISAIVAGALRFNAGAVIQLGLLLLIATPVARVVLSLVAFTAQRDRLYMFITSVVLGMLIFGLFFSSR